MTNQDRIYENLRQEIQLLQNKINDVTREVKSTIEAHTLLT